MRTRKRPAVRPLDIAVILALAGLAAYMGWRVEIRLDYDWRWELIGQYLLRRDASGALVPGVLTQGLLTTVRLSVWTMLAATLIGTVMGLARTSTSLFRRLAGQCYVGLVRNTPPLVLMFIFYFFLADQLLNALNVDAAVRAAPLWAQHALALTMAPVNELPGFLSGLMTLAVYEGAYITEHVRAGVQSVERGQFEAAYALGLSPWQRMRHVVMPQALPRIVPPLAGQFISTIKDSAIVSVISIQELTFQGMELMAATYMTFEIWITVALLYLALTVACSLAARRVELRFRRGLS
nr:amino acid ABC transporter permease [Desulfobaculum xiamenense]